MPSLGSTQMVGEWWAMLIGHQLAFHENENAQAFGAARCGVRVPAMVRSDYAAYIHAPQVASIEELS